MTNSDRETAAHSDGLRLGILLDEPTPVWAMELVNVLASTTGVELAAVIVGRERARRSAVVELFGDLDRRLFASADDPFLASREALPAAAVQVHVDDPSLQVALEAAALDVLLHLGEGHPPTALLELPVDLWWFDRGGVAPYLADLARGVPVSTTTLVSRRRDVTGETDLSRWVTRADLGSWHRTQVAAYRQSTELVVKTLRNVRESRLVGPAHDARAGEAVSAGRLPRITARAVRRRIDWERHEEQWGLAVRARRSGHAYPTDILGFTSITPPAGRSWADPFLATADTGERYVFFEDQSHDTRKGVIACAKIDVDGLQGAPRTVLERDFHLSYPFVFKRGEEWFLLPESSANRTVELYRATVFPTEWEQVRVLLEDVYILDATPFEHEGRTWIFASSETATGRPSEATSVYWADSLLADWHPHPLNPVVTDVRAARPAGRIISHSGRLIRPAQDGSHGYGCALVFNEITELTPTTYEERGLGRISADWLSGGTGTHHYDVDDVLEIIDVRRRVRRRSSSVRRRVSPFA